MLIRRATLDDAAPLAELAALTFTQTFGHLYPPEDLHLFLTTKRTAAAYAKILAEPGAAAWAAVDEAGRFRGYAVAGRCGLPVQNLEASSGELRELYVDNGAQGHGLGTRLLDAAFGWLKEQKRTPLYIGVWSENHGAQRLYARHGFSKIGEYDFPVGSTLDREFILRRNAPTD